MMRPWSLMSGTAARTAAATPPTLMANWRSRAATSLSGATTWPTTSTPALLTRMSSLPKRRAVLFTSASTCRVSAWSA